MTKPFDPFTATREEALALMGGTPPPNWQSAPVEVQQWVQAQRLTADRERYEKEPIHGVALCIQNGLVAPDWLRRAFGRQYLSAMNFEVESWDKAFGQLKPSGRHLESLQRERRIRKEWAAAQAVGLSRKNFAALLDLTEKEQRTYLAPTRRNSRGHKPYKVAVGTAALPNDPFNRKPDEPPKN